MSLSPLPASLQQLAGRRFSFYPAIRNVDHNEWIYRRSSWTEVVVVNAKTGVEYVIPRAHIGDVSRIDDPVVIVGLRCQLEAREGLVRAWHRPVIELPVAVNQRGNAAPHPEYPAQVVSIRLEPHRKSRLSTKVVFSGVLGVIVCLVGANLVRSHLNPGLDYDHTVRASDGRTYRLIRYHNRKSIVVLDSASHYVGTLDPQHHVLDAVTLPDGTSTAPLLRSLPSF
jgi:hypothetical protein